jgi:catechol 2,3-dioxygenase-like lactoylglutathione lyase family enzyme
MDMKMELVPVPVSDVDRAKTFYVDQAGFTVKADVQVNDERRVVQLTPPGSACSIVFGTGIPKIEMRAGSLRGLHLMVEDVAKARQALADRGVKVGPVEEESGVKHVSFSDPDGNTWALQQIPRKQ